MNETDSNTLRILSLEVSRLTMLVNLQIERIDVMSAALERLTAEVAEVKGVMDSAITLIGGLADQIRDLKDDPAALEALANDLHAKEQELAAAISANTTP